MRKDILIELKEKHLTAFNLGWVVAFMGLPRNEVPFLTEARQIERHGFFEGWDTFDETINPPSQRILAPNFNGWMRAVEVFREIMEIRND